MTQRQQFVVVPREPTPEIEQAAADVLDGCVKSYYLWGALLEAAPPPPEHVLSDEEVSAIRGEWGKTKWSSASYEDLIRVAERAVLTRLTEIAK